MGECGCDIRGHRCGAHADDVILVLTADEAGALLAFLERPSKTSRLPWQLHAVKSSLRRGGVPLVDHLP